MFSQEALQRAILNTPEAQEQAPQTQPSPALQQSIGIAPYLALLGGQGADMASTAFNMNRGYGESNPAFGTNPSLAKILAMKAGLTGGIGLLMHHMAANGHPTAAKVLGYMGGIGGAIPAAINLSQK